MLIEIDPLRPNKRHIGSVAEILEKDGVVILPTDTSYAFSGSIDSKKAMQKIYHLRNLDNKQPLSFLSSNLAQLQEYTQTIPNPLFRTLKTVVPGKNTFIFRASKETPKRLLTKRSLLGIRIPEASIATAIVNELGKMLLIAAVPKISDEDLAHHPKDLYEEHGKNVDCLIDAGELFITQSSVIDFSGEAPVLIRQGDSDVSWLNLD